MQATYTGQPPYQVVDPATGKPADSFDFATDAQVEAAVATAQQAYTSWCDVPIEERAESVRRVAALFGERAPELARLAQLEMGKTIAEGIEEVEFCQSIFEYYASAGSALTTDQPLSTSAGRAVVQRRPLGVLLGVMPWNFPFYQVARFAAPNLVLGNTIILKHAESVPRSALAIEQIFRDAGLPDGAYANIFATHRQVETIIADSRIQGVSVTGSARAGADVAATAGRHLKKCVLELGGSDPFIVLDTDDVAAVAQTAWSFRMYNNGQACNSNKRMIVVGDVFDEFVSSLVALARATDPATIPPMVSRTAAEHLAAQVSDAVGRGAALHAGGELLDGSGAFFTPAVLTGVRPGMRAYDEELFGPVAVVYRVENEDEAIELANATEFGLGGSVFSTDTERATRVAQRLDVGMASVNAPSGEGAELPFGGVKRSGFGRELGPLGLDEFANKRLLYVAE